MSDVFTTHRRLIAAGLSEERSRTFLRLLTDAEGGRYDRQTMQEQLRDAQFTAGQAVLLVDELLQRLARRAGGST
jgi:hypothetical protein